VTGGVPTYNSKCKSAETDGYVHNLGLQAGGLNLRCRLPLESPIAFEDEQDGLSQAKLGIAYCVLSWNVQRTASTTAHGDAPVAVTESALQVLNFDLTINWTYSELTELRNIKMKRLLSHKKKALTRLAAMAFPKACISAVTSEEMPYRAHNSFVLFPLTWVWFSIHNCDWEEGGKRKGQRSISRRVPLFLSYRQGIASCEPEWRQSCLPMPCHLHTHIMSPSSAPSRHTHTHTHTYTFRKALQMLSSIPIAAKTPATNLRKRHPQVTIQHPSLKKCRALARTSFAQICAHSVLALQQASFGTNSLATVRACRICIFTRALTSNLHLVAHRRF